MTANLKFFKKGKDVKKAMSFRIKELSERLERRNQALDELINDTTKIRSFLIFSADPNGEYRGGHNHYSPAPLRSRTDISSEEEREIRQLCRRIFETEQEIHQLKMAKAHLQDEQEIWLAMSELQSFGFKVVED